MDARLTTVGYMKLKRHIQSSSPPAAASAAKAVSKAQLIAIAFEYAVDLEPLLADAPQPCPATSSPSLVRPLVHVQPEESACPSLAGAMSARRLERAAARAATRVSPSPSPLGARIGSALSRGEEETAALPEVPNESAAVRKQVPESPPAARPAALLSTEQPKPASPSGAPPTPAAAPGAASNRPTAGQLFQTYYIGRLYFEQGRYAEAEPLWRSALQGRRAILGDQHIDTLASISAMGRLLRKVGRADEAEPLLREAMTAQRETLGGTDEATLTSVSELSELLHERGACREEAEALAREALDGRRKTLGDGHALTRTSIAHLAQLLKGTGGLHTGGQEEEGSAESIFLTPFEEEAESLSHELTAHAGHTIEAPPGSGSVTFMSNSPPARGGATAPVNGQHPCFGQQPMGGMHARATHLQYPQTNPWWQWQQQQQQLQQQQYLQWQQQQQFLLWQHGISTSSSF